MQVKMLWGFFKKMWSEKHNMVLSLDFKWLILILLELLEYRSKNTNKHVL